MSLEVPGVSFALFFSSVFIYNQQSTILFQTKASASRKIGSKSQQSFQQVVPSGTTFFKVQFLQQCQPAFVSICQSEFSLPRLICVAFVWNGLLVLSRDGMLVVYTISKVGDGTNLIFYCRASHNYFSLTYRFHCVIFLTMKIFARECCQIFLCYTVQDAIPVSA